ncbi:type I-E CRISPR-associated endoribonuclease Cas2e [Insolitispirillum peregrinum]|uniref:type I-E CRISPR-associated endoribonuclease Cas2e n=1 Tax=Insolitispirillum peregrinum TaxID=80876 RepID=UPI0009705EBC
MLVVVANNLPPAVRGRMKLWFIEPRANVFVSGVKDAVALEILDDLFRHCPPEAGLLCFRSLPKPPGYEIRTWGATSKDVTRLSGLQLVVETISIDILR